MSYPSTSRPMASLPHHHQQQPQPQSTRPLFQSPYNPDPRELHSGPRNRLILALRSTVDSEIDWALPRLVLASFDQWDRFILESWVGSRAALLDWPERWVGELEKEAALDMVRNGRLKAQGVGVLGVVPEWTRDERLETRAINSLQILRNAGLTEKNARYMAKGVSKLFDRLFALPLEFLLDLSLRLPEAFQHILTIYQAILYHSKPNFTAISTTLPLLLINTRDLAILALILPILISALTIPNLPPPPESLLPHLLNFLTLTLPPQILESTLDLLISLTLQPPIARQVLSLPSFPAHLKILVTLLERDGRPHPTVWNLAPNLVGVEVRNPASVAFQAEEASRRRTAEREIAQKKMEATGGTGVIRETGDKPPTLSSEIRTKLYQMAEPMRSITWMHETFVYSSSSQLRQVIFWHAYREFFQHASTVEQLLSASEVIKNVTIAFPGAHARIWYDELGEQKFVIAGMGFRPGTEEHERFACLWEGCDVSDSLTNPSELLQHVQSAHTNPVPLSCEWASCTHSPFTISHLLTHLPGLTRPNVPETLTVHPTSPTSPSSLSRSKITSRPIPPLPNIYRPTSTGLSTPVDKHRQPTGIPFLSALVIRNLARTLKGEMTMALPIELTILEKEAKKRHLMQERFGLPIPEGVLKEEEEEEEILGREGEGLMDETERVRAKMAFEAVEEGIVRVIETNLSGLGMFLPDAFGW